MHRIFGYLLTLLLLMPSVLMAQTTFYVSSIEGSDSNPGTSAEQAWQSLEEVNSYNAHPGDQILFKRGEAWEGTLIVSGSGNITNPVIYGAYGYGEKPVIYGSAEVTGWTPYSGNIYKATIEADNVKQLFLDDSRMKSARYPNEGYFDITTVTSTTEFTSSDLDGEVDYSDAICFLKNNLYSMYAKEVTNSSLQTFTLSSAPSYNITVGSGFWLTNKLDFLTEPGEWHYDSDTNTLYLWAPNGDSPENYTVRASTIDYGVKVTSNDFVTISDLEIKHSGVDGIYISNSKNITIDNCNIINPDLIGVNDSGASATIKIMNSYISGANGRGISLTHSPYAEIIGNTIEETGQIININKATFAKGDGNFATAINSRGNNHKIQYNRIINTGYCGINFQGLNTDIKYNYINGVCQTFDDGGGIYTYSGNTYPNPDRATGSVIENNIILNCFGETAGSTKKYTISAGVYLDDNTKGVTARYNTISGAATGIFVKGGHNIYEYNTVHDAALFIRSLAVKEECKIVNNIFYQSDRLSTYTWWTTGFHGRFYHGANTITDYNLYIAPYSTSELFYNNTRFISYINWKLVTGQDTNSTFDGTAPGIGETEKLFYNDSKQTKIFDLGDTIYRDLDGEQVNGTLTLDPFTSKILIKTNLNDQRM